jgi:hypothetical protein
MRPHNQHLLLDLEVRNVDIFVGVLQAAGTGSNSTAGDVEGEAPYNRRGSIEGVLDRSKVERCSH